MAWHQTCLPWLVMMALAVSLYYAHREHARAVALSLQMQAMQGELQRSLQVQQVVHSRALPAAGVGALVQSTSGPLRLTHHGMLEDLGYEWMTDKSRDDHGYVGPYAMIFDGVRNQVRNMTEIGVLYGKSIPFWHSYFTNAQIWALDVRIQPAAYVMARDLDRVRLLQANSQSNSTPTRLGLVEASMDVIIDDGDHSTMGMQTTFEIFWPLLRPGGYYIIEDIATGANAVGKYSGSGGKRSPTGFASVAHNPSPAMRRVFDEHDVFFADVLIGSRVFDKFAKQMKSWMKDHVDHNSHMLVIRRRNVARTQPPLMHFKSGNATSSVKAKLMGATRQRRPAA